MRFVWCLSEQIISGFCDTLERTGRTEAKVCMSDSDVMIKVMIWARCHANKYAFVVPMCVFITGVMCRRRTHTVCGVKKHLLLNAKLNLHFMCVEMNHVIALRVWFSIVWKLKNKNLFDALKICVKQILSHFHKCTLKQVRPLALFSSRCWAFYFYCSVFTSTLNLTWFYSTIRYG